MSRGYGTLTIAVLILLLTASSTFAQYMFESPVDYDVGNTPNSLTASDLNGDGLPDLACANINSGTVSVLISNGDGTFQDQVTYSAGTQPVAIFAEDFNADGYNDLVVANQGIWNVSSTWEVTILMNVGNGTFVTPVSYRTSYPAVSVSAADLNGDHLIDLAVGAFQNWDNNLRSRCEIFINQGAGGFTKTNSINPGGELLSLITTDLDGDGDNDLVVMEYYNDVVILKNIGDGTFQTPVSTSAGGGVVSICAADLDDDSDYDLAVANYTYGWFAITSGVTVLENKGDGSFEPPVDYASGTTSWSSIVSADFDSDGDYDLAFGDNRSGGAISILINRSDGTFQDTVNYMSGLNPRSIVAADFDGDGYTDLVIANSSNSVSILFNRGEEYIRLSQYDYMRDRLSELHIDLFEGYNIPLLGDEFDMSPTDVLVDNVIGPGNATQEQEEAFQRMLMSVKLVNAGYRYVPSSFHPLTETDEISGAEELWDMGMENTVKAIAAVIVIGKLGEIVIDGLRGLPWIGKLITKLFQQLTKLAVDSFAKIVQYIPNEDAKREFETVIPLIKYELSKMFAESNCVSCVFIQPAARLVLDELVIKTIHVPSSQPAINEAGIRASGQEYTNTVDEANIAFANSWNELKNTTDAAVAKVSVLEEKASSGGLIELLEGVLLAVGDGPVAVLKAEAKLFDAMIGTSKAYYSAKAAGTAMSEAYDVPALINTSVSHIFGDNAETPEYTNKYDIDKIFQTGTSNRNISYLVLPDELSRFNDRALALADAISVNDSTQIFNASDEFLALSDTVESLFDSLQTEITVRLDSARIYEPDLDSLLAIADSCGTWASQRITQCVLMALSLQLDPSDISFNDFSTSVLNSVGSELEFCWNGMDSVVTVLTPINPAAMLTVNSADSYLASSKDTTLTVDVVVYNKSFVEITDVYIRAFQSENLSVVNSDSIWIGSIASFDSTENSFTISLGVFPNTFSPYETVYFDIAAYSPNALSGNLSLPILVSTNYCCGIYTAGFTGNTTCDFGGLRDLADITRLIDNIYISKAELCCIENGNVNGDAGGLINLADITMLIDHVYISKDETAVCN